VNVLEKGIAVFLCGIVTLAVVPQVRSARADSGTPGPEALALDPAERSALSETGSEELEGLRAGAGDDARTPLLPEERASLLKAQEASAELLEMRAGDRYDEAFITGVIVAALVILIIIII
jgi:hypothetical protein